MFDKRHSADIAAKGHLAPLDGLRGIAILLVLFVHFGPDMNQSAAARLLGTSLTAFGWTGVDLFFVLSGFLITRVLLDSKGAINYFAAFYARRALRILPVYYMSLVLLFVGTQLAPPLPAGYFPPATDHPFYWLYLQNWTFLLKEPTPLVVIHLWSLAVEEQFYLVWPVLVYFLSPRTLLGVAIMGCLVALALRLRLVSCAVSPEAVYRSTFCRMDALMLGAGCAVGFRIGSVARLITGLGRAPLFIGVAGLGAVRLTMTAYDSKPMQEFGYTIVAVCYTTLLSYTVATVGQGHMVERLITSKPLAFLGKYSYGMYLYHVPVYRGLHFVEGMLVPARKHFGLANVFAAFTLTILLSYISYHLFELPFLNLKRRFRPRFGPGRDPAADGAASTALTRSQT